ncbi:MAG: SGNH/GDSL hydrolase family protein [Clostridia bacterium]|nr:SGNH/GDSL hydrolase family protein [Clostridia bacterium]
MKNLVVFGDSIPKGIIYEDGRIKRAKSCAVDILHKYYDFDCVVNNSVYGQTLARLMAKRTVDDYLSSVNDCNQNFAAICIGGNDADYDWRTVAKSPEQNHTSVTAIEDYAAMLDCAVKKLKQTNHEVFLLTLPPVYSQLYFSNVISKIADGDSVLRFLDGDVSNIYRHQELFNYEIVKCAFRNSVKLIDIRAALLGDKGCSQKYCIDGVHPNEMGQSFMANTIISHV